jgi:ABC-type maltose transport system permease subunit
MFVNAHIINRKEKKNPSHIIIDTFVVLFSLFLKFPLYVIILFYRPNTALQKAFIIKNISLLNLKQIITNSLK